MPFITTRNSEKIYYEIHGSGYPLILISGIGGDSSSFNLLLNELKRHYKVVIFDNRGSGYSYIPNGDYFIEDMADDLNDLMNNLNISKANILGHSMGGFILQEFAIKYPSKLNKIILSGTASEVSARNKDLLTNFSNSWKDEIADKTWYRNFFYWCFTHEFFKNRTVVESSLEYILSSPKRQKKKGFAGQVKACCNFSALKRLNYIETPTLVLYAEKDILVLPEESLVLNQKIKESRAECIKDAAHIPYVEQKENYLKEMFKFINYS